ncbi:hypothetical protein LIL_13417 [Leptospira interrogans serovar Linhai str. 56609]|nr:hypothetical protein LIL_13417 [Leptospira interrogans serovar Linhai str. 56609]OMH62464.1 hypothetical protein BW243_17860 [Leptospira interrogans serovar Pomona]OOB95708.1 hypothetical protein B0191_06180 [Leptospira interrogans serovar Hardjo]
MVFFVRKMKSRQSFRRSSSLILIRVISNQVIKMDRSIRFKIHLALITWNNSTLDSVERNQKQVVPLFANSEKFFHEKID